MLYIPIFLSMLMFSHSFITPFKRPLYQLSMRASKKTMRNIEHDFIVQNERNISPVYKPRGPNQKKYVKYLKSRDVSLLVGVGPAGTGKTLFACYTAIEELKNGNVNKIVLTRPVVPVEEDIGYLPGTLVNKMNPWTRPIFDIFEEFYSPRDIDSMIHSGIIEISPLAFMRGRTFKNAFVIADEMQNSSPNQMFMLATRLGEGSRMVITGDLKQSDRCEDNGLLHLLKLINSYKGTPMTDIRAVQLDIGDVERSKVVSNILSLYSDTIYNNTGHSSFSVFSLPKKEDLN